MNPAPTELDSARMDLLLLDFASRGCFESPVAISVAMALTVAADHPGVETRILCKTEVEVTATLTALYSCKLHEREHAKWNSAEGGLEMPNGSLVVVMFQGKRAVPR
jgi:hypothetical protein